MRVAKQLRFLLTAVKLIIYKNIFKAQLVVHYKNSGTRHLYRGFLLYMGIVPFVQFYVYIKLHSGYKSHGNLLLAMEIDYGMSSFIARNKLLTLRPNSYLHTQTSEIQVTIKWSKQLHIFCSVPYSVQLFFLQVQGTEQCA